MYVLLTNKPGEFKTELTDGLKAIESYDYIFYGRKRANFTIAEVTNDDDATDMLRIKIVEDEPPHIVNKVPSKLFEHFDTIEDARAELGTLTTFGSMDIRLERV